MVELSVIVPVYNVEKYLKRCISSIITQTYKNFELILIDDGSLDRCGAMCDEFAQKDSRIRVIHQSNKGLAETRNVGIRSAQGAYISFIDSDDYILPQTYSDCMRILHQTSADIICFQHIDVYDNQIIDQYEQAPECVKDLTAAEAYDALFYPNYVDVITCNKIIKKSVLEGIEFPAGKLYEDMFTTYKYISKAKKISVTNQKYYVYCHREGSIGTQKYSPRALDLAYAAYETYENGVREFPNAANLEVGLLFWLVVVANMMIRSKMTDASYIKRVQKYGRKNVKKILFNPYYGFIRKMQLLLFSFSQPVYKACYFKFLCKRHSN